MRVNFSPEVTQQVVDMLPAYDSLRAIGRDLGLRLDDVRLIAQPFITLMRMSGSLPNCECGRPRFHPYGCKAKYSPADHTKLVPGHPRERTAELLERRRLVIDMLVAGHRFVDINSMLGIQNKTARHYLRFLSPEQMAQRERAKAA